MRGRPTRRSAGRRPQRAFPWDSQLPANQTQIQTNFDALKPRVVEAALDGVRPTVDAVRTWHRRSLWGVRLAEPQVAGGFRGEGAPNSRLRTCQNGVRTPVGVIPGAPPAQVRRLIGETFDGLNRRLDELDARIAGGDQFAAYYADVLDQCAWLHGEWVRIHPFVDHNGSTARLLTMSVGLIYGVPLDLPGKPRSSMPSAGLVLHYEAAANNQMAGDDQLMVSFLHDLASTTP